MLILISSVSKEKLCKASVVYADVEFSCLVQLCRDRRRL
jgi:hypothetical protein